MKIEKKTTTPFLARSVQFTIPTLQEGYEYFYGIRSKTIHAHQYK